MKYTSIKVEYKDDKCNGRVLEKETTTIIIMKILVSTIIINIKEIKMTEENMF